MSLEYDVLIATRNRMQALRLSVPLILTQTKLPSQLIIVDAGDDYDTLSDEIKKMVCESPVELKLLKSQVGSAHQRNVGLAHVHAPVVMMPDDDSLWYSDYAEHVMRIYEKDTHCSIGGVGGKGMRILPAGIANRIPALTYKRSASERLKKSLDFTTRKIEKHLFPDPFNLFGLSRLNVKANEWWMLEEDAIFLPQMEGYRMSYRTKYISPLGFDELLGRYALFEDIDACFGVLKHYLIVEAMKARLHHYKSPEPRVSGLEWGVMQVLNKTYVTCKHAPPGSLPRKYMKRFLYYRFIQSLPRIQTIWARERIFGMFRSLPFVQQLLDSPLSELAQRYSRIRDFCLHRN